MRLEIDVREVNKDTRQLIAIPFGESHKFLILLLRIFLGGGFE